MITIANGIIIGDSTQNQDQAICPVNLRTINTIVNSPKNPIPPELFALLIISQPHVGTCIVFFCYTPCRCDPFGEATLVTFVIHYRFLPFISIYQSIARCLSMLWHLLGLQLSRGIRKHVEVSLQYLVLVRSSCSPYSNNSLHAVSDPNEWSILHILCSLVPSPYPYKGHLLHSSP